MPNKVASDHIQFSNLDHPNVMEDTLEILAKAGCRQLALKGFSSFAQQNIISHPLNPEVQNQMDHGYFQLESVQHLLSQNPPSFSGFIHNLEPPRMHSLMCFDVALLLMRNGPVRASSVLQDFSSKYFLQLDMNIEMNGLYGVAKVRKSDDYNQGATLLSPLKTYQRLTGLVDRSQQEEHLAISLRAARAIPGDYSNSEMSVRELFKKRVLLWERDGLQFSPNIKLVMAHWIDLERQYTAADHIGLAVRTGSRWMYLEKNGTTNPLVRINFNQMSEIVDYVSSSFDMDRYDPNSPLHRSVFFISVNEEIHWIDLSNY